MRYWIYSFLNIFGLAIGMACAMLIILWTQNEWNIDKFHANGKKLYQIRKFYTFSDVKGRSDISMPGPLGIDIKNDIPEIVSAVRVTRPRQLAVHSGEKSFFEDGCYADSNFFRIFSFKLIQGNSGNVLESPNSVAISQKLASKFFGEENTVGKTLTVGDRSNEDVYIITGVFKDVENSSMKFDMILPFSKYYQYRKNNFNYNNWSIPTFILVKPNIDINLVNKKIGQVARKHNPYIESIFFTQLFEDTYLYNDFGESMANPSGRIEYIKIFSWVAFFIIILACMNYTNLATALATKRAKEIGIKKVFGANNTKLVLQFTFEAIALTFVSFFFSLIIIECSLPFFSMLVGKEISLDYKNIKDIGLMLAVPAITGLFAGVFPAFYMSSFNPAIVLKSMFKPKSGSLQFRHILVTSQFVISIAFIISSFVILKQMRFIQSKQLGLDKENVIFFDQTAQIMKQRNAFKEELKKQAGIINATFTGDNPIRLNSNTDGPYWRGKDPSYDVSFPYFSVDQDFFETMGIEIIEGRSFSSDYPNDTSSIVINQKALQIMNLKNPIGEVVRFWNRSWTIIGVAKDFHFSDLHSPITQMMILYRPYITSLVMVKISSERTPEIIANIEKVYHQFDNNAPFKYSFLDQDFEKDYESEKYMGRFSNLFSILAIIISCLGLFGLALFTADQKTKEIGIRKSVGVTTFQIVTLLAKDFLKWIAIAYIIACIISCFVLYSWLQNFAYRTSLSWWIFAATGLITFAIALITVSWQSYRAASKNPVESLRYE
jgi:putative ABC transport system permease protein